MQQEIRNRVAESKLETFNLEAFYPEGDRVLFDIKDWLDQGFILKEKQFRALVNSHNWEQYKDSYVALHCSTDAIVPTWAYMLITTKLTPYCKKVVLGNLDALESVVYRELIQELDLSAYKDKPVIVKGCSNKPVPEDAYLFITSRLQEVAKSVMYGEACSSVPLYKRK
jgi:fructose-1-phosphate kinase PfkB-like protein